MPSICFKPYCLANTKECWTMLEFLIDIINWILSMLPDWGLDEILTVKTPEVLRMKSMFLYLFLYWTIVLESYSITFAVGPIMFLCDIIGAYGDHSEPIDEEGRLTFFLYLMVGSCFATFLMICYYVGPDVFF